MSRISPHFHFNVNEYNDEELDNICPRYLKWMKKVKAFDFSKRKKGKIDRAVPSFDLKYKLAENSKTPKRSKNFLSKIRRGGQNLRVRVRTSADLWRRWIRGGIMYNTELNEKDEIEQEEQESRAPVIIKVEPQPIQATQSTQSIVPKPSEVKESKQIDINNNNSEIVNKSIENEKMVETKTESNETNVKSNGIDYSDQSSEPKAEDHIQTIETEPEKDETKETQSVAEEKTTSEEIPESNPTENVVKSNTNSNTNLSPGMPEVVVNND